MEFGTNKKNLTVVIPTYNRKEPLREQLKSLEKQGHYDDYEIIISDNHSNYDVEEMINQSFQASFTSIITVFKRPCNVGGDMNVSLCFQLPTTEWMWLLSDDDISENNSIETILNDINAHQTDDVCWIKYSISGGFAPNREEYCNNLVDTFNYYSRVKKNTGELVFVSNNVYRMTYLEKYLTDVCIFSDTCMSQALLPLLAIKKDTKQVLFSPHAITNWVPGRGTWAPIWAYLRFGNFLSITSISLDKNEIKAFKKMPFWGDRALINSLASETKSSQRNIYFKKIFISHYDLISLRSLKIVIYYSILSVIGANNWLKLWNKLHSYKAQKV